jgi:hypothetical protein
MALAEVGPDGGGIRYEAGLWHAARLKRESAIEDKWPQRMRILLGGFEAEDAVAR